MSNALAAKPAERNNLLGMLKKASASSPIAPPPMTLPKLGAIAAGIGAGLTPSTKSPSAQEAEASCTFDVLQLTTTLASFAASINDVSKTCEHVSAQEL